MSVVRSGLSNGMGNLLNRCTSLKLNPDQIYPCKYDKAYNTITKHSIDDTAKLLAEFVSTYFLTRFFGESEEVNTKVL